MPAARTSRIHTQVRRFAGPLVVALVVGFIAVVSPPSATAAVGRRSSSTTSAGNARGRTVTPLPVPGTSTTPPGVFTESGGKGTLVATGNGNSAAGVRLDYDFPALDLTSGVSNTQFFLEFDSIKRLPEVIGESSILVAISVTDSSGATGALQHRAGQHRPVQRGAELRLRPRPDHLLHAGTSTSRR